MTEKVGPTIQVNNQQIQTAIKSLVIMFSYLFTIPFLLKGPCYTVATFASYTEFQPR